MKLLTVLSTVLLLTSAAFGQIMKYPFGAATSTTLTTTNDTFSHAPVNSYEVLTMSIDSATYISFSSVAGIATGNELVMIITADASANRALELGTYLQGSDIVVPAGGTVTAAFKFDGSYYKQTSVSITSGTTNANYMSSYPYADVDYIASASDSLTLAVTVDEQVTYLDIASTTLDTTLTINVTVNSNVIRGAVLYVESTADGTNRNITWGTNITEGTLTNTADKTFITPFIYNGTSFVAMSAPNQID